MDTHHTAQMVEDVLFLLDAGVPVDQIAKRLGVKKDSLDTAFRRQGKTPPWVVAKTGVGCTVCSKMPKGGLHPATYVQATERTSRLSDRPGEPLVVEGKFCSWTCFVYWMAKLEDEHGPDARNRDLLVKHRLTPMRINDSR